MGRACYVCQWLGSTPYPCTIASGSAVCATSCSNCL
jgi:hypothetical protein